MIFHDSRNADYRAPSGAVPTGSVLTLNLRATGLKSAYVRVWWADKEALYEMTSLQGELFTCVIDMPLKAGVLWYYFKLEDQHDHVFYYGNAADQLGGVGEVTASEPRSYQITVYDRKYDTPHWMRNGNMMQIMVDRFHASGKPDQANLPAGSFYHANWNEDPVLIINDRTGNYVDNDYFGGNLKGIEEKLDMLEEMGITILYLNPIFKAHSNHKYNTGDYMQIDPTFGTEEDFSRLCAKAKEHGIRIMLDGVFSHTGTDSLYFNKDKNYGEGGAYNDPKSPYREWFDFKTYPDVYESWWGVKTLPNVKEMTPSYRKYIISDPDSVIAHWTNAGAGGWRLDVADELPMAFIRELRKYEKKLNPEGAVLGEVWEDPTNKISYGEVRCYCLGDTLDATMNYPLRDATIDFMLGRLNAPQFARLVDAMKENQPACFFYSQMNLLSSHDKPRAISILAGLENLEPERAQRRAFEMTKEQYALGKKRLMAAFRFICAMPGMPCVYYGDNAGLYSMGDPFCRGTYPWGKEDTEIHEAFSADLNKRKASVALRTGRLKISAYGNDVIIVVRDTLNGHDAFGEKVPSEQVAMAINRSEEMQIIQFENQIYDIAGQTAIWLNVENQDKKPSEIAKNA